MILTGGGAQAANVPAGDVSHATDALTHRSSIITIMAPDDTAITTTDICAVIGTTITIITVDINIITDVASPGHSRPGLLPKRQPWAKVKD